MAKTVGQTFKDERKKRRWTLEETAKKVDCFVYYICNIENGKRVPVNGTVTKKLCDIYGLDYDKIRIKAVKENNARKGV